MKILSKQISRLCDSLQVHFSPSRFIGVCVASGVIHVFSVKLYTVGIGQIYAINRSVFNAKCTISCFNIENFQEMEVMII